MLFKISASAFILKIFVTFCKFQPRYSYKTYSYKKECTTHLLEGLPRDEDFFFVFFLFLVFTSHVIKTKNRIIQ